MSEVAVFRTCVAAAVAPDPPQHFVCHQKTMTTTGFQVEWGVGNGRGNAITSYIVCMDDGLDGAMEIVYRG
jgi:hypothetical protein